MICTDQHGELSFSLTGNEVLVRTTEFEGEYDSYGYFEAWSCPPFYAYQVVLLDEFASCGVEVLFVNSSKADTPEEALLLQFQGMPKEQTLQRQRK